MLACEARKQLAEDGPLGRAVEAANLSRQAAVTSKEVRVVINILCHGGILRADRRTSKPLGSISRHRHLTYYSAAIGFGAALQLSFRIRGYLRRATQEGSFFQESAALHLP